MRIALIVPTTMMLAGLAAGTALARELPPIKTVGIVSDVGDKITLKHIGFMVFSNSLTEFDVPDWQLDAFITADLEAALKQRYELHPVTFAKGAIAPDLEHAFWKGPSPKDNVRANATPADGQPIDAYLVVWPRKSDVYPTNQYVTGLGLLTMGSTAALYANVAVTLVDGRTFEEIDDCWPTTPGDDINRMLPRKDLKAESFDAMTPEQKQALQQGLKDMLHDGLAYCLNDLKLTP